MKIATTIAVTILIIAPALAFAQEVAKEDCFVTISGGLIEMPSFLGSGESNVVAIPNITLLYGDCFTASLLGGLSYEGSFAGECGILR